ncbi:Phosphate transport system permease protein PstA [Paramagnetospirillum magnetotacticum MS-1]|uniref:Phosphate transport system permease protein PstA n=1 Tax=Paramagnetospirillum magnetotacticum MS-1 TaxID=272627 RepID=A0A0C2YJD3_PARME|nr:phosphate ABC transporter permease PstA [Paramagnetospirillum magnetotacticum]KIL99894.1 Phosphate transport system permease protein PstA [Paramagnetospirillum magnetotacticum MS-1]
MAQASVAARTAETVAARLGRRYAAERRFRLLGLASILISAGFLVLLLGTVVAKGWTGFFQTQIAMEVSFDADVIDPDGNRDPAILDAADYPALVRNALAARLVPDGDRSARRDLSALVSTMGAEQLRRMVAQDPGLIGAKANVWLLASDKLDMVNKGQATDTLNERQLGWLAELNKAGLIRKAFNAQFFTGGDSRAPEQAGIWGAVVGSFFSLLVTLAVSFPLGVATAVYLEEFAPKNRWTDLIEVNINNLAAVPSVVFGLLGLAVFLNVFHLPRSSPVAGGLVLALICLPTIIIAGRAALKAVPPSIRQAAAGLGASPLQIVAHHVLPLAMPGMLTGTILGMARALGETAPLLMIGMVAFIVDIPKSPLDPSAVLPVQIYLWAGSSERAFVEKTSAAIMVLLLFLVVMNMAAIWLRNKFERRW